MSGTGSGSEGSQGLEVTKDNFIPLFDKSTKNYKEQRVRIVLYG